MTPHFQKTLAEILNGITDWNELQLALSKYNTTKGLSSTKKTIAGKLFEVFTKYYFLLDPINDEYECVWLYEEIPLTIKEKLQLPPVDHGIDLLLRNKDDEYVAVQCKFKNDESKTLSWSSDKIANVFALGTNCRWIMVFSNCASVTKTAHGFKDKYIERLNGDLLEITQDTFNRIYCSLLGQIPGKPAKLTPHDHQNEAINAVHEHFQKHTRGQLILPCGAGKTLTSLWIKEKLVAKKTLVLVPSLALLKQIKNDWARQKKIDFSYTCVCSEKDIDSDRYDNLVTNIYEIGSRVTTNKKELIKFLSPDNVKVVFSTYHSIGVIEEAIKEISNFKFDLVICDEAHRTAGTKEKNTFTIIHDNNRIKADRRLYMTATPRVVSTKLKNKLGNDASLVCDMSDPSVFGTEAYRMSFGDAISKGILVDYKILGIGVTDQQVKNHIDLRTYTGKETIEELAHNFALEMVMKKYGTSHSLTFHSRVKLAEAFSNRHKKLYPNTYTNSVDGKQTTTLRNKILDEFRRSDFGVVSNARCLTEGVDIPTIDLIYFCDPKTSKIDIIQASGRALRKDTSGNKKIGYIVIPIFHNTNKDLDFQIKSKPILDYMIKVIRSLCDQDERLESEINSIAYNKGSRSHSHLDISFLKEDRIFNIEGIQARLKESLYDIVINKVKSTWEQWYLELKDYKDKHGTFRIPSRPYNYLSYWAREQRRLKKRGQLDPLKIKKLESIQFNWNDGLTKSFQDSLEELKAFKNQFGHLRISRYDPKWGKLGEWLYFQKRYYKIGRLNDHHASQLRAIGVILIKDEKSIYERAWLAKYEQLKAFFNENGHSNITQSHPNESLYNWVKMQRLKRKKKGKLSSERIKLLNQIQFLWDGNENINLPPIMSRFDEEAWNKNYAELIKFIQKNGHGKVPQNHPIIGRWVNDQRNNKSLGKLLPNRQELLNRVGFIWDTKEFDFEEKLMSLKEFKEQHGHFNVPQKYDRDATLYHWVYRVKKKGTTKKRAERLKEIGFDTSKLIIRG